MDKTIIVGIGGTGCDAIREIRKKVVEVYGSLDADEVENLGFLYIDTDSKEVDVYTNTRLSEVGTSQENVERRWEVLGQSIRLNANEYVIIKAPEVASIVNNIESFPHFKEWFPVEQLRSIDKTPKDIPGARQIRPLGRFAFTLGMRDIERAFRNKLSSLKAQTGGGQTRVYMIASLSGGTGAGMILDLAYAIQDWTNNSCQKYSFMVFPDLATMRGERYLVNAYATLLELNYYNVGHGFWLPKAQHPIERPPFDNCYLVGTKNALGVELDLKAIPAMIAHRIFLNFDSSFSAAARSMLNNAATERGMNLEDPFNGNQHSQNFFTFGLSTIQFPLDEVIVLTSQRLVSMMFRHWLKVNVEAPKNIAEHTRDLLSTVKLSDDYLLGNKDYFGNQHFESYAEEIKKMVNKLQGKLSAVPNNLLAVGQQEVGNFDDTFRNKGIMTFYQDLFKDVRGMADVIMTAIEKNVSQLVIEYGFDYARNVVKQMTLDLTEKKAQYYESISACAKKASNTQKRALPIYEKELNQAEFAFIRRNKKKTDAITNYLEVVKAFFDSKIGEQAYTLGDLILVEVLNKLEDFQTRLKECVEAVNETLAEFEDDTKKWETFFNSKIDNEREFNGSIMFSMEKVNEAVDALDTGAAIKYLQDTVIEQLGSILRVKNANSPEFRDDLRKAASKWVYETNSTQIFRTDVVKELLSKYPEKTLRAHLLHQNANKAQPFLQFNKIQEHMAGGKQEHGGWTMPEAAYIRKAALLNDEGGRRSDVLQIKKELCDAANLNNDDVEPTENTNEIFFLEERTAFPLRVVQDVEILRNKYLDYIKESNHIPVHLRSNFDPPLMSLFLVDKQTQAKLEEREDAFALGRVMGFIRIEENQHEERDEVRYRYEEYGIGQFTPLGWDWEDACTFFNSDEARTTADHCLEAVTKELEKLSTRREREELGTELRTFLDDVKANCKKGEEDPVYQRYQKIVLRIIGKHRL